MFINFSTFAKAKEKYGLTEVDFFQLVAIKQKETEFFTEEDAERYLQAGLVKKLKTKNEYRLDRAGDKLLIDLSTDLTITDEIEKLFSYLERIYKGRPSGIVKNKTETKRRMAWFSNMTGIKENKLAMLMQCFCKDSYNPNTGLSIIEAKEENPRLVLSNMLDNVFWAPKDHFSRHYKLEESPLFNYLEDNRKYIEKTWEHFKL